MSTLLRTRPDQATTLRGFTPATAEVLERRVLFSQSLPAGAQLVWGQPPANVVVNGAVAAPVTVELEDSTGRLISNVRVSVTLSVAAGPGAEMILGAAPVRHGVATFRRLVLSEPGSYTLQAATVGLATITAGPISVVQTTPPSTIAWSGPIVINAGGTYSGNWQSLKPDTPAVVIETADPVVIVNANIESKSTLIQAQAGGANLTVESTHGWALNPNIHGQSPGRFLDAENFHYIDLEHNTLTGTAGIELGHYQGDGSTSQTVKILYNSALNIDGRRSNGAGGFQKGRAANDYVQFCQLNACTSLSGVEIAWNQVINLPRMSRVEDNVSIFESSGTSSSPILIHDNYIQGAYPVAPSDGSYTGGGIMVSDGNTDSAATDTGFVQAYNNIVIGTTDYGIAISSGHDDTIHDNVVISSGRLASGTRLAAGNVGIYVWNAANDPFFGNDQEYANTIGWMKSGIRNDQWLPNVTPSSGQPADTVLPAGPISLVVEQSYYGVWAQRLAAAGLTIGAP